MKDDPTDLDLDSIANLGAGPRLEPPKAPPPYVPPPGIPPLDDKLDLAFPPINDLDEKTREYLRDNPHVWTLMVQMTKILLERNESFGMKMLVEVARWKHIIDAKDRNSSFKLSNSYTSYIVRLLIKFFPPVQALVILKEVRDVDFTE